MSKLINIKEQNFSILGHGSQLKGTFKLNGNTLIKSSIEGDIIMDDKTTLTIGPSAKFSGTIQSSSILIQGKFDGVLTATSKIVIFPTATLKGEINGKDIVIHPGATINADIHTID